MEKCCVGMMEYWVICIWEIPYWGVEKIGIITKNH